MERWSIPMRGPEGHRAVFDIAAESESDAVRVALSLARSGWHFENPLHDLLLELAARELWASRF